MDAVTAGRPFLTITCSKIITRNNIPSLLLLLLLLLVYAGEAFSGRARRGAYAGRTCLTGSRTVLVGEVSRRSQIKRRSRLSRFIPRHVTRIGALTRGLRDPHAANDTSVRPARKLHAYKEGITHRRLFFPAWSSSSQVAASCIDRRRCPRRRNTE